MGESVASESPPPGSRVKGRVVATGFATSECFGAAHRIPDTRPSIHGCEHRTLHVVPKSGGRRVAVNRGGLTFTEMATEVCRCQVHA